MKKLFISLIMISISMVGCIENDIPLPYVKGDVLDFFVRGQISNQIDPSNNIIKLNMSDTVDLRRSYIEKMRITAGGWSNIDSCTYIDLTKDTIFEVFTYQKHTWTISVTQKIDRFIKMNDQIGDAVIDAKNKNVVVQVSTDADLSNMTVEKFQLGPSNATTLPNPLKVKDFRLPLQFVVQYWNVVEVWDVIVVYI